MLKGNDLLNIFLLACALCCRLCKAYCNGYDLPFPKGSQRTSYLYWYAYGYVFRFECQIGYHFVGNGSLSSQCSADGTWLKRFQGGCERNKQKCGPTKLNVTGMSQGVLTSPGYPYGYPSNLDCTYKIITSDKNHRIKLEFNYFSLRPPHGYQRACLDYVDLDNEYYAGGNQYSCASFSHCAFCGSTKPATSYSYDNFITIMFKSDQKSFSAMYKGWSVTWYNERINVVSGGSSSNGADKQPDLNDNTDEQTDGSGNVMHGTTIFLLVFLPVLAVFGVAFSYLRWKGRLAHFRARSSRLVQNGLIASEVGPAIEEPAHIMNSASRFGPRLPGYTETSTPLEPPPPYDGPEESNRDSPATSTNTVPPPSYDSCAVTSSPNENTSSSDENKEEETSVESTDPVIDVVVQN